MVRIKQFILTVPRSTKFDLSKKLIPCVTIYFMDQPPKSPAETPENKALVPRTEEINNLIRAIDLEIVRLGSSIDPRELERLAKEKGELSEEYARLLGQPIDKSLKYLT